VTVPPDLLNSLICPRCRGVLHESDDEPELICSGCGTRHPIRHGIPVLLPSLEGEEAEHKRRQLEFFDQDSVDDFGVTRPRGAPSLYRWLLEEKFRRSVLGLEEILPDATVLTICAGSGVDAELLSRTRARVIVSDISVGVLLQARERARRFGLDFNLIAADAEALPFRDGAVDLVYVHDGLHHLERPAQALAEMARVARLAVSVSEPARARATAVAVRVGWAQASEEAGNPVLRLTVGEVVSELEQHGFRPLRPHRYAMYYRHWPGRAVRLLSKPVLFSLAKAAFLTINAVVGRFGNKLTVQALRQPQGEQR
jgi:SAM-dependent methyltransferase